MEPASRWALARAPTVWLLSSTTPACDTSAQSCSPSAGQGLGGHQAEVASPVSHHLLPFTGFLAKMPWPHHTTEVLCLNELGQVGR